jgi:hypothetical protein
MKFSKLEEQSIYWSGVENALIPKSRLLSLEYKGKKNDFSCYKVLTSSSLPEYQGGEIMIDERNKKLIYSKKINTENKNDILHAQLELSKANKRKHLYRGFSLKTGTPENNCIEVTLHK